MWVADHRRPRKYSDKEGDPALAVAVRHRRKGSRRDRVSTMAGNEMGMTGRDRALRL